VVIPEKLLLEKYPRQYRPSNLADGYRAWSMIGTPALTVESM
jgi:hypothetical protein